MEEKKKSTKITSKKSQKNSAETAKPTYNVEAVNKYFSEIKNPVSETGLQVSESKLPVITFEKKEFIEKFSPGAALTNLKHIQKIEDTIFNEELPSIARVINTFGQTFGEAALKMWLVNMNEGLNLKRPLVPAMIDEIAAEICSGKFKRLNFGDVSVIVRRMKYGHYGQFFESLSISKIMEAFELYYEERIKVAERISSDKSAQHNYYSPERKPSETKTIAELQGIIDLNNEVKNHTDGI